MRDLEKLGVQVWTSSSVTHVDQTGVEIGHEKIEANTVLWAAGVRASTLGKKLVTDIDALGRVMVEPDLSITGSPHIFVAGDQSNFSHQNPYIHAGLAQVLFDGNQRYDVRFSCLPCGKDHKGPSKISDWTTDGF